MIASDSFATMSIWALVDRAAVENWLAVHSDPEERSVPQSNVFSTNCSPINKTSPAGMTTGPESTINLKGFYHGS